MTASASSALADLTDTEYGLQLLTLIPLFRLSLSEDSDALQHLLQGVRALRETCIEVGLPPSVGLACG